MFKNPIFEEEQEWRIVSPYFANSTVPQIKYREGASMILPYIEVKLDILNDGQHLFENVFVGPTPHANISITTLSLYLSQNNATKSVSNSNLPYREW